MHNPCGLSFRGEWLDGIGAHLHEVDAFELVLENCEALGLDQIQALVAGKRVTLHWASFSIGGAEPLNRRKLEVAKRVVPVLKPEFVGVHLAITEFGGTEFGLLAPIVLSTQNLEVVVDSLREVQDALEVPLLLENIAYYFELPGKEFSEAHAMRWLCERARCKMLLDVNNLYVNSINHGFDAAAEMLEYPLDQVEVVHIAGCAHRAGFLVDSHADPVHRDVYALLRQFAALNDHATIIFEQDRNLPPLETALDLVRVIRSYCS